MSNLHRKAVTNNLDVAKLKKDTIRRDDNAPMRPPRPPVNSHIGHTQCYGFPVDRAWLMEFAKPHMPARPSDMPPETERMYTIHLTDPSFPDLDFVTAVGILLRKLVREAKCSTILPAEVFYEGKIPEDIKPHPHLLGPSLLIFMMCEFREPSWRNRPTIGQVKKVSEILGRKGRWWTHIQPDVEEDYDSE